MVVTDATYSTLRAFLVRDFDEHRRFRAQLDPTEAQYSYTALIAAAFFSAVERRFGENGTDTDIIKFVADTRAQFEGDDAQIDPHVAETMIHAVLGKNTDEEFDDEAVVMAQVLLLGALIADENLDDAGLDAFLTEARGVADQWLE